MGTCRTPVLKDLLMQLSMGKAALAFGSVLQRFSSCWNTAYVRRHGSRSREGRRIPNGRIDGEVRIYGRIYCKSVVVQGLAAKLLTDVEYWVTGTTVSRGTLEVIRLPQCSGCCGIQVELRIHRRV